MTGRVPLVPPMRVTDRERDRVLALLRQAVSDGRLSTDTFSSRVDVVLRARARDELAAVVADLGPSTLRWVSRMTATLSANAVRLRGAWAGPQLPRLSLPRDVSRMHLVGRHPAADLVLDHPSVSRWHADFRFDETSGSWMLRDRSSTNGTRLNGWRIRRAERVHAGDRVDFALVSVVLAESG